MPMRICCRVNSTEPERNGYLGPMPILSCEPGALVRMTLSVFEAATVTGKLRTLTR